MTKPPTDTPDKPKKKARAFWKSKRPSKGQTDQRALKAMRRAKWPV